MKTLKQHSFSMRECDHDVELLGEESERFRCSNTISVRCAPRACSLNLRLTLCFEEVGALSIVKQTRLVFEERCLATSSYQSMVRQFASERCDRRNLVGAIIRKCGRRKARGHEPAFSTKHVVSEMCATLTMRIRYTTSKTQRVR